MAAGAWWVVRPVALERPPALAPPAPAETTELIGRLPLVFEPGGSPSTFIARTPGYSVRIDGRSLDVRMSGAVAHAVFDGATAAPSPVAGHDTGARRHYLVGSPDTWRTDEPLYSRIEYRDVYPGIDVAFYGTDRRLEYDFIVHPGADPSAIRLRIEAPAEAMLDEQGHVRVRTGGAALQLLRPITFQPRGTSRTPVASRYRLDQTEAGSIVSIDVAPYDHGETLVIDPVLGYAMPLGGAGFDDGHAVAVDQAGNVYVAGTTLSSNFPTAAPGSQAGGGRGDVFVAKLASAGGGLLWSTVIGGSGLDEVRGLAVDDTGAVYLAGLTTSPDFPTVGAAQGAPGGSLDGFVAKLAPTGGALVFATYLGGAENDEINGLALDASRSTYVVGTTYSSNLPVLAPRQPALAGGTDAFVAKLGPSGALAFSTYHGGSRSDDGRAIAVDGTGAAVVAGSTQSTNFPLAAQTQGANRGGLDAFVSRFTPTGGGLAYSTYLGGSDLDGADAVRVDGAGRLFVAGTTRSADFPVLNGPDAQHSGDVDAFLVAIAPTPAVIASTYVGGSRSDRARGLGLDAQGRVFVAGQTASVDLPAPGGLQPALGGSRDGFIAMFGLIGSSLVNGWTTYHGGGSDEDIQGIAVDRAGRLALVGTVEYATAQPGGASDVFVVRMSNGDPVADTDHDGMPNEWETQFDLDPLANDAGGDLDGDGVSNLDEYRAGSHPAGRHTRYLAEGATSSFFSTELALGNTSGNRATVLFRFQKADGTTVPAVVALAPGARSSLDVSTVPSMTEAEFSTVIESNEPVVVDRTMVWDRRWSYGSHAETSIESPATTWYLAEGATGGSFDLFYLIQNPGDLAASVQVTYLLPSPAAPVVKTYSVPPRARFNIWVDQEDTRLRSTDISARIVSTNNQPILVERAMYMRASGQVFGAGHESAAITTPSTGWFLAEGATGDYFDLFVLVANPNTTDAAVRATFLLPDGTSVVKTYTVRRESRFNIWVDQQDPRLANAAVSTIVESTNGVPIIVERAMWWPGPTSATWTEAHNSFGTTVTGTRWALAGGERGGTLATDTYVLVANASTFAGQIRVTLSFEDDGSKSERLYAVAPRSRHNVPIGVDFPEATGRRFSTLVESVGAQPAQIVVERAMYSDSAGRRWAAGTNALATRLAP
jgi:hypothetical protein